MSAFSRSALYSDRDLLQSVVTDEALPAPCQSILSCHCTTNDHRVVDSSPWYRSKASGWGRGASEACDARTETANVAVSRSGWRSTMDSSIQRYRAERMLVPPKPAGPRWPLVQSPTNEKLTSMSSWEKTKTRQSTRKRNYVYVGIVQQHQQVLGQTSNSALLKKMSRLFYCWLANP